MMREYWERLSYRQGWILVLVFAVIITLTALNVRELKSGDETRVAGISAEMFLTKDYLVPRLNGTPFLEYPPLYYWGAALSYSLFGINDFAAKLPSALAALGCGLLTFLLAKKMKFPAWSALLSSVMLMTSAQFFNNSRKCMVDMVLAFFILLAVTGFFALVSSAQLRFRLGYLCLFIIAVAGGIYTKGLLGICIPVAVLGSWLFIGDILERKISWMSYVYLGAGSAVAIGIASVWYILLGKNGAPGMLHTALVVNNFGRFSGSQGDHVESFSYYFIKLPTLFFPWLPLLPFAIWQAGRKAWYKHDRSILLLSAFLLVPFAALCCASSKRIVYLLPLYAPCALLCGCYLTELPVRVKKFIAALCGKYPRLFQVNSYRKALAVCIILAFGMASIDVIYVAHSSNKKSLRPLFDKCSSLERAGNKIILMSAPERTRGAAYFYLHHELKEIPLQTGNPPPGEYWIVRDKEKSVSGKSYADHHKLIGKL